MSQEQPQGQTQEQEQKICKIVLVGEAGVGKTNIINRYTIGKYDANEASSESASFVSKSITLENGHKIIMEIWDTCGQEVYRSLNALFYRDALIAIMVYDITNKESFKEVKEYWHKQLKEQGEEDVIIGIAGNKCDKFAKEQVEENEVRKWAKEIGAAFRPTSAKDNLGIDDLFYDLLHKFDDNNFQFGQKVENLNNNFDLNKEKAKKPKAKRKWC